MITGIFCRFLWLSGIGGFLSRRIDISIFEGAKQGACHEDKDI
jgi:hypothetical protein